MIDFNELPEPVQKKIELLESSSDCYLVIDYQGKIVFTSGSFETYMKWKPEVLLGKRISAILEPKDAVGHDSLSSNYLSEESPSRGMVGYREVPFLSQEGEPMQCKVLLSRVDGYGLAFLDDCGPREQSKKSRLLDSIKNPVAKKIIAGILAGSAIFGSAFVENLAVWIFDHDPRPGQQVDLKRRK